EDGIRCFHVTGVQTCALPIYRHRLHRRGVRARLGHHGRADGRYGAVRCRTQARARRAAEIHRTAERRDHPVDEPRRSTIRAAGPLAADAHDARAFAALPAGALNSAAAGHLLTIMPATSAFLIGVSALR